jgi:cellulose synthase/poly-beta-1,6-N-acetylglucosamine synthase-like glycosyltransferase
MDDFTIVVATFGTKEWRERGKQAAAAVEHQAPVVHVHGKALHTARNTALERVETEFVIHLDADDSLEAGYVEAMARGVGDLLVPRVRNVRNGQPRAVYTPSVARHHHLCEPDCLLQGNYIVVGAAVRTELVKQVGGWQDESIYEDWSLWLRCHRAGAVITWVPQAIYRAHQSADSRNHSGLAYEERDQWHGRILDSIVGDAA